MALSWGSDSSCRKRRPSWGKRGAQTRSSRGLKTVPPEERNTPRSSYATCNKGRLGMVEETQLYAGLPFQTHIWIYQSLG